MLMQNTILKYSVSCVAAAESTVASSKSELNFMRKKDWMHQHLYCVVIAVMHTTTNQQQNSKWLL